MFEYNFVPDEDDEAGPHGEDEDEDEEDDEGSEEEEDEVGLSYLMKEGIQVSLRQQTGSQSSVVSWDDAENRTQTTLVIQMLVTLFLSI